VQSLAAERQTYVDVAARLEREIARYRPSATSTPPSPRLAAEGVPVRLFRRRRTHLPSAEGAMVQILETDKDYILA
jgi:hypothetical protein